MHPDHEEVVLSYSNYRTRELLLAIARSYGKTSLGEGNIEYVSMIQTGKVVSHHGTTDFKESDTRPN